MARVGAEELEGVGNEVDYGVQGFDGAGGLPGEVQNHRGASNATDGAAQDSELGAFQAFGAHAFRDAFQQPVTDGAGRFRGDIARRNTGAASGDDKAREGTQADQGSADGGLVVRNDFAGDDAGLFLFERGSDGGATQVRALSAGRRIADGDDRGGQLRCRGGHLLLRFFLPSRDWL